ncbi:hypothetical protein NFB56_15870, partial [Yersinia ruckeri]|uniref:gp53-like domain-containing protein n=1 Tax=Yersinia ruckeri TaxID=29486 RepID=UPI0028DE52EF|nr:hypothetical protein [Yersinia ruckeri]
MALKLNERYPGRFNSPTPQYPQGSFKNRTAPGAKDGSYLEQDWANDQLAFFSSLLENASLTPNGKVDVVGGSQYYNALSSLFISGTVPISKGGTGATTASTARIQLGLGDAAQKTVGIGTNQIPDMSFFIRSLYPDSGWVKFPNGIILQCIQVQGEVGNVASAKTFPTPFPTFAIGVFGTCKNTSSAVMVQASIVDEAH